MAEAGPGQPITDRNTLASYYPAENLVAATSSDIRVAHLDLTLIWPLVVQHPGLWAENDWLDEWERRLRQGPDSPWTPADQTYPRDSVEYSEFVYFHPFVQKFLYAGVGAENDSEAQRLRNPAMRVLQRDGVKKMKAVTSKGDEHTLTVRRLELYLFDTGVVLLAIKLTGSDNALALDKALDFLDEARRVYAPYWCSDGSGEKAGHCLRDIQWIGEDGESLNEQSAPFSDAGAHVSYVRNHRQACVVEPWRVLLEPMVPADADWCGLPDNRDKPLAYRQVVDERIPCMCYLAVDQPRRISDGDWLRLLCVDASGDSARYPYSPSFVQRQELLEHCCYDRYWCQNPETPAQDWFTTRFLCSGYGFTVVGKDNPDFFMNQSDGMLAHFRHHYFKMGLIAYYHHASLLGYKHQLSQAVADLPSLHEHDDAKHHETLGLREVFRAKIERIRQEWLRFRSRYWFPEISNQVQGRELFNLWSDQLGNKRLFDEMTASIESAEEVLNRWAEGRQTLSTTRLTVVATVFLVAIPLFDFFKDSFVEAWKEQGWISVAATVIAAMAALLGVLGIIYATIRHSDHLGRMVDQISHRARHPSSEIREQVGQAAQAAARFRKIGSIGASVIEAITRKGIWVVLLIIAIAFGAATVGYVIGQRRNMPNNQQIQPDASETPATSGNQNATDSSIGGNPHRRESIAPLSFLCQGVDYAGGSKILLSAY